MKIAYFDCFAGAGGDMLVAAMLDAGLDPEFLKNQVAALGLKDLRIKITRTQRGGIKATSFVPIFAKQHNHRNIRQITDIIDRSKISSHAKKTAIEIFNRLTTAEAAVHGKEPREVFFHELGAVDAIADIVAAAVGVEYFRKMGVEKIYCSALCVGGGTVKCEHGLLPVPAPATAELLKNVPIVSGPVQKELLTPTAAAVLTTIVDEFCPLPAMKIEAIGYGAGTMEIDEFPNVVRLILGQSAAADTADTDCICLLETNVDDISGEVIGSAVDKLFEGGALDVFTTPIYMKHNRPAVKISVICEISHISRIEQILFGQGLTFGIRRQVLQRSKLTPEFIVVETEYGQIRIKLGRAGGKVLNAKPEFSDCLAAAKTHHVSVKAVIEAAMSAYAG